MQEQPISDGPVVYFIQPEQGGPIKIGYCNRRSTVPTRLNEVQTGNPYSLVIRKVVDAPNGHQDERAWHEKFAAYRLSGEWFLDVPEVAQAADALLPAPLDEARLLRPLLDAAFKAGRTQGCEETELRTRLMLRDFFDRTMPWLFGEEWELHESLEANYAELAISQILNLQERKKIRSNHADWMRRKVSQRIRDGLTPVASRSFTKERNGG